MSRVGVAGALEQVEAAAEPLEDLFGPEQRGASGCQLYRKRQVVESAAQLSYGRVGPEAGINRACAGGEEVEALGRRQLGNGIDVLAGELQTLTAGDDELRTVEIAQGRDRSGHVREQVLGVVEHEEHLLAVQHLGEHPLDRPVRLFDDVESARGVPEDEAWVPKSGERHPPDAVGKLVANLCCGLERKSGLPGSTRPGQR